MTLAYGRISQEFITVTNEDDVIPIFTPWIAIREELEPERADHYVVGLQGNIIERLSLSLETYYKNYASISTYNRDKFDVNDPDYVNSTGQSSGAEMLVRFAHPFIDIYCSYSIASIKINDNGFVYPPRYDRRHTLNFLSTIHAGSNLAISSRWAFGSGLPYTQAIGFYERLSLGKGYPITYMTEKGNTRTIYGTKNAARLPPYHRLDLNISYRLDLSPHVRSSLGVAIINVYDRKNMFYYDAQSARRVNQLDFFPSVDFSLEVVP